MSVISVNDNYAVTDIDFSSFAASQSTLMGRFACIWTSASFEGYGAGVYCISDDSKTAYVTLRENNAIC